jgi:hypothetical protein
MDAGGSLLSIGPTPLRGRLWGPSKDLLKG